MIKFITKTILIISLCTISFFTKAQVGYDYAQYDVGTAVGVNIVAMADVNTFTVTPSVHFNFNYNQSPFVNYVFELQVGRLEGGTLASSSGRMFENHFTAFSFRGQLQAGEFLDYSSSPFMNVMKNWYVSTGIGYISNHIVSKTDDKRGLQYTPAGDNNAQAPFVPARIGYEFKLYNQYSQPSVKIDLGFQYNFAFSDNLDGYTSAGNNDAYAQFTIGVKFAIGGVTSYRKQIHY
ncbi:hypothetical protein [Mucilaginibacter ginsenosidivorax]|uniref:Porin family protein n=1 Tax=Mucilaginibacter ginsenosidivorax TaxID=862126 RepID=A0A5B8W1U7_9SPHI|nr:hypothetical protein [Mucilaginibacter ginsenosidivorax]QEC78010.1 hypothetical protein FSB76_19470 [Mucilaginibacter ginsenosidivorax]